MSKKVLTLEIILKSRVSNEEQHLRDFLYHAIYVAPGDSSPQKDIINEPHLASYYEDWGKKDDQVLFALSENLVVGACWTRCFPDDRPGYGTIHSDIPELSLAVLPKYRGKGIGTKLLERFFDGRLFRYAAVSLSVHEANPAIRLYQRFGFKNFEKKGQSVIMIKRFDQSPFESAGQHK